LTLESRSPAKSSPGTGASPAYFEDTTEEESPYERRLRDAVKGDRALFAREDAVDAAWVVVDPVLKPHHGARPYTRGSWGLEELTRSSLRTAVGTTRTQGSFQ